MSKDFSTLTPAFESLIRLRPQDDAESKYCDEIDISQKFEHTLEHHHFTRKITYYVQAIAVQPNYRQKQARVSG